VGDGVVSGIGIDGVTDAGGVGRVSIFAGASFGGGVSLRVANTMTTAIRTIPTSAQTNG
jgi:TRAP-type uncharacterized transport system fused permease subunit